MEDRLRDIFSNVNDWLKFAESKNAVIVAFNGAVIFGTLQIVNIKSETNIIIKLYVLTLLLFMILSFITALISFLPRIKLHWLLRNKAIESNDNLIFYGDIVKV